MTIQTLSINSNYHDIESFSNVIKECHLNGTSLLALHLNILSLPAKMDDMKELIADMQSHHVFIDFILLCETWLNENNSDGCNIPGYTFIQTNRKHKKGGGVAMYIKSDIKFKKIRTDVAIFESICG